MLLSSSCIEPVRHRDTAGVLIQKAPNRIQQRVEVGPILSEGRGPERPIQLVVGTPVIQLHAKLILLLPINIHFVANNGRRKQIQTQDAIPDQIVFLTPSALPVESESIMVAILGFLGPSLCKLNS